MPVLRACVRARVVAVQQTRMLLCLNDSVRALAHKGLTGFLKGCVSRCDVTDPGFLGETRRQPEDGAFSLASVDLRAARRAQYSISYWRHRCPPPL